MSFIEGVGDEVIAFAVILLVLILAATITFLLNTSPFSESRQLSQTTNNANARSQNQEQQQPNNEGSNQDSRHVTTTDSNHTTSSNVSDVEEMHSITEETEIIATDDDNEVCSENIVNSQIYPDINECVSPSAPDIESEENVEAEESQSRNPEDIHVRLKYLDDTERTVTSHPTVKIGDFKRTHFAEDIANNKVVRLIFSGQLLQDNATLRSYSVANNCVIHVQILQAQTQQSSTSVNQNTDLDLSHLLWPLLSLILGICWILYLKYPEFFSVLSLGLLLLFTGSFIYFNSQIHR